LASWRFIFFVLEFPVSPEEITEDTLPPLLKTKILGRRLYAYGQCESTMLCAGICSKAPRRPFCMAR